MKARDVMRTITRSLTSNTHQFTRLADDHTDKHWREHSKFETSTIIGMQMLHALFAVSCVVFSITYYATVWNCGSDCDLYATNTFLSTSGSRDNRGWPVLTDSAMQVPPSRSNFWPLAPYFSCMQSAGMATDRCNNATVDLYTSCVTTNDVTKTALGTCLSFTGNYYFDWPTGPQFMNCLFSSSVLAPALNVQNSRKTRNAFRACMSGSPWPFFETVLGPDTMFILGSFNWGLFGSIGLVGFASFSVYTMSTCTSGTVEHGTVGVFQKLGTAWALIAMVWTLALLVSTFALLLNNTVSTSVMSSCALLFNLALLIVYFGLELLDGYRGFGRTDFSWDLYPAQYKGKSADRRNEKVRRLRDLDEEGRRRASDVPPDYAAYSASKMEQHPLALLPEQPDHYQLHLNNVDLYASPLLALWADGYTICDTMIWLSVAGATGQLTTDCAWNMFTLVFLIRLNNSNIARLLFECFHSDHDLHLDSQSRVVNKSSNPVDQYKTSTPGIMLNTDSFNGKAEPYLDLKVLALSMQFANVLFFISLLFVVYDPNQLTSKGLFNGFMIMCFFIPEGIRLLVHLYCQVEFKKNHGLFLLLTHQFIWNWDVLFRIVYLGIILLTPNNKDFFGTLGFLKNERWFVLNTAVGYMAP